MNSFVQRCLTLVLGAALLASCRSAAPVLPVIQLPPALPTPSVNSRWVALQTTVLGLIAENRSSAADSSLLQFSKDHARTTEGDRARWWRTLMRADPRSTNGDPAVSIAHLDSLLADSIAIEIRAEAVLMRRTVITIDSLRRAEVRRRTQATQLATDRLDEIKVARDSVTKLLSEIERLRRRLRAP
jgi:hypothetical protein